MIWGAAGVSGLVMCLLSKLFLVGVFVPVYLLMSVAGKQKVWFSLILSLCVGMLFFMIIPMLTPLDAYHSECIFVFGGIRLIQRRARRCQQHCAEKNEFGVRTLFPRIYF